MLHGDITERIALLQNVELFAQLSTEELEIVASYSQIVHFNRNSLIFSEKSPSNEMYVIKNGTVLITRRQHNDQIDLAQFIAGESFGEWDFLGNTVRNATAAALFDTDVLVFPKAGVSLTMVLHKYPKMSAQILYKLLGIIARRIRSTHRLINEKTPWIQNLKKQIVVDKLTGLYNKNFLLDDFDTMLTQHDYPTSLLMIKLDNFKEVNDRYGHYAGDQMLVLISIFIAAALRENDIPIRYGGDEFAAVLPDASRKKALRIAREVSASLSGMDTSRITGDPDFRITLSIGVATHPIHGTDARTLIEKGYEKMNTAKNLGGNRIVAMH